MASSARRRRYPVYLVSDLSGNLLEHFFSAVLTQFPDDTFNVTTLPFLDTEAKLRDALDGIEQGIVCHAIADPKLKALVTVECARRRLRANDVTGPTVQFLEAASGVHTSERPKPVHKLDAGYMGRMAALEFAMQHDDNRRIEMLGDAEIVLVGLSRSGKSPTALFLAYRGFKVANVSLVPSEGLPEQLRRHRRKNVVALTIQPKRLAEIRHRRFAEWGLKEFDYTDLRAVIREVRDAEAIYRRKRWPVVDTTDLAVEETSTRILQALKLKPKLFQPAPEARGAGGRTASASTS